MRGCLPGLCAVLEPAPANWRRMTKRRGVWYVGGTMSEYRAMECNDVARPRLRRWGMLAGLVVCGVTVVLAGCDGGAPASSATFVARGGSTVAIPAHVKEQEPAAAAIAALRSATTVLETSAIHVSSSTGRFLVLDAAEQPVTGVVVNRDSRGVIGEIEVLKDGHRHGPYVHWTSEEGTPIQAGWWIEGEPVGVHRRWYRPRDGGGLELVGVIAGDMRSLIRVEYGQDGKVTASSRMVDGRSVDDTPPVDHWPTWPEHPAWSDKPAASRPADLPVIAPK
jgi:hypothetical protein